MISGIKIQNVQDYVTADGRFSFSRSYASRSYGRANDNRPSIIGQHWAIDNLPRLEYNHTFRAATLFLNDHQALSISCYSGECTAGKLQFSFIAGVGRAQVDYTDARFDHNINFTQPQNTIPFIDQDNIKYIFKSEEYDGNMYFAIRRVEYPGGYHIDYENQLIVENIDGIFGLSPIRFVVTKMTDSFGRTMTFDYNVNIRQNADGDPHQIYFGGQLIDYPQTLGLLKSVTLPDETKLNFTYDSVTKFGSEWNISERLKSVYRTVGDSDEQKISEEIYHYENETFPFALTGVTDSAGIRYSTWEYSDDGLAISSEHAGGVDRYDMSYDVSDSFGIFFRNYVTSTNPLGKNTLYKTENLGAYFNSIEGEPSPNCVGDAVQIRHVLNRIETTDKEGHKTITTHDDKGWEISRTTDDGGVDVTTSTTWHPAYLSLIHI